MTGDDASIFVGDIAFAGKRYQIFVKKDKNRQDERCILLTEKDLGEEWINHVLGDWPDRGEKREELENDLILIRLYVLYSVKRRVCFSDLADAVGLERIIEESKGCNPIDFYFEKLQSYMALNHYKYRPLITDGWLYMRGAYPYFPVEQFEAGSVTALISKLLSVRNKQEKIYGLVHRAIIRCGRRVTGEKTERELKKSYVKIEPLRIFSQSGSLFYHVWDKEEKDYFVKAATVFSDSLTNEFEATRRLDDINCDGMVLPERKCSTKRMLVYPYCKHITLKEYCERKRLTINEHRKLCLFLKNAIMSLNQCGIMHRDITPVNILVTEGEEEIESFLLTDFGTAVIDNDIKKAKYRRHVNLTCGSRYRYSEGKWDDAYSAFQIALEAYPQDGDNLEGLNMILSLCNLNTLVWKYGL